MAKTAPADRPLAALRRFSDAGEGALFPLEQEETLIGRDSTCTIPLSHPYVSRRHARILRREDGFYLEDLGSLHGTFLNDQPVQTGRLRDGDEVRLGKSNIRFQFLQGRSLREDSLDTADLEESLERITRTFPSRVWALPQLEKIRLILDFHQEWKGDKHLNLIQFLSWVLKVSEAGRIALYLREQESLRFVLGLRGLQQEAPEEDFAAVRPQVEQSWREMQTALPLGEGAGMAPGSVAQRERKQPSQFYFPLRWLSPESGREQLQGLLYLESSEQPERLSSLDRRILARLALEMSTVLEKLELLQNLERRKELRQEMELAREAKANLLPRTLPRHPRYQIWARSLSCQLGADFYDFVSYGREKMLLMLADVAGRGVGAALLSSMLQGALAMLCRAALPLDRMAAQANQLICDRSLPNQFISLFLLALEEGPAISYLNAGHSPPLLYRPQDDGLRELTSPDPVLGVFSRWSFQALACRLQAGDLLLIYSDGITQSVNRAWETFERERLAELLRRESGRQLEQIGSRLLESLEEFREGMPLQDDVSLILLRRL